MVEIAHSNIDISEDPSADILASKLESFALALSEREYQVLAAILLKSMAPLDRIKWRDITQLLDADEEIILRDLEAQKEEY